MLKKIMIIGSPGTGKSTLAKRLRNLTNFPTYSLDAMFWQPGWVQSDTKSFRQKLEDVVNTEKWIIDGNYSNHLDLRLPKADLVIYLDFIMPICLFRVIKRSLKSFGRVRSEMADGCTEKIDLEFYRYVVTFPWKVRSRMQSDFEKFGAGDKLVILQSNRQVERFVKQFLTLQYARPKQRR